MTVTCVKRLGQQHVHCCVTSSFMRKNGNFRNYESGFLSQSSCTSSPCSALHDAAHTLFFFKARTMLSWQHHLSSKPSVPFSIYGAVADVPVMSWVEGGPLYHHRCCFLNSALVTSGHSRSQFQLKGQNVLELEKRKNWDALGQRF